MASALTMSASGTRRLTWRVGLFVAAMALVNLYMLDAAHGWSSSSSSCSSVRDARCRLHMTDSVHHATSRRATLASLLSTATVSTPFWTARAEDGDSAVAEVDPALEEVQVLAQGDARKIFNEGRALEMQGNMAAAQRAYSKVTKMAPRFIYGWSNLGNTEVALGALAGAEDSYSTAINLCNENLKTEERFGVPRCGDLYLLLLNRGALRLNNGRPQDALKDLQRADSLRGKPDAVVLENLARAKEINGMYGSADRDYTLAISMTSNEGGYDLLRRVENRFPEAPEVRAAYATFLAAKGDQIAAQRKYLEIPDRQRKNYVDNYYLRNVINWPPAMIDSLGKVTSAVGDSS